VKRPINDPQFDERLPRTPPRWSAWKITGVIIASVGGLAIIASLVFALYMLRIVKDIRERVDRPDPYTDSLLAQIEAEDKRNDSLESIDIFHSTITGIRGHERVEVPYMSDRATLLRLFGRADSTTSSSQICYRLQRTLRYHYSGSFIDVDPDDAAFMRSIDLFLNPDVQIRIGDLTLTRRTTLKQFKRLFPISGRMRSDRGYKLRPLGGRDEEFVLFSFDEKDRLASIHYVVDC
jgi:hypothetical protein